MYEFAGKMAEIAHCCQNNYHHFSFSETTGTPFLQYISICRNTTITLQLDLKTIQKMAHEMVINNPGNDQKNRQRCFCTVNIPPRDKTCRPPKGPYNHPLYPPQYRSAPPPLHMYV